MDADGWLGLVALYEFISRVAELGAWLISIWFFWQGARLFKRYRRLLESMRTCDRCGREIMNPEASHCGRCGHQLAPAA